MVFEQFEFPLHIIEYLFIIKNSSFGFVFSFLPYDFDQTKRNANANHFNSFTLRGKDIFVVIFSDCVIFALNPLILSRGR